MRSRQHCRYSARAGATVRVQARLRTRVVDVLLQQEMLWFAQPGNKSSELASRLSADCHAVASIVSFNVPDILKNGLKFCAGSTYLLMADRRLACCLLVMVAALCFMNLRCAPLLHRQRVMRAKL